MDTEEVPADLTTDDDDEVIADAMVGFLHEEYGNGLDREDFGLAMLAVCQEHQDTQLIMFADATDPDGTILCLTEHATESLQTAVAAIWARKEKVAK